MKTTCPAAMLLAALFTSVLAFGQRPAQSSGIDITGDWFTGGNIGESNAFVMLVEYGGIPLSEAGRLYALTWDSSRMTLRQQQCAQYDPTRLLHGGGNTRFWEERDPYTQQLISIKIYGQITEGMRTVWMDGPPASSALRKTYFPGILHRQVRRNRPDRLHDSHQAKLDSFQRRGHQRRVDGNRAFY